jgi:hypothetical protein
MGRLARALEIRAREAVGMVEMLFHFTDTYAPRGDVGRFDDLEIAIRLDWDGDAAALIAALVGSGWVDEHPVHRLVVHDWPDHAPEYTKKKANGTKDKAGTGWAVDDRTESPIEPAGFDINQTQSENVQKIPENSGLPSPSKPSPRAKPSHANPPAGGRRPKPRTPESPFPDPFPAEHRDKLAEPATEHGVDVDTAIESARDWAQSHGHRRRDWVAVIRRGIREGYFPAGNGRNVSAPPGGQIDERRNPLAAAATRILERAQAADGDPDPPHGALPATVRH